ncbi:serine hydrolase [Cecembia rubra]|uniref:serine hydrolase n=1 Tax=Cecembia rubra TaxID=1485585 RepID=UPI002714F13C|nr:serine hydrolase [Cecembia rubra]
MKKAIVMFTLIGVTMASVIAQDFNRAKLDEFFDVLEANDRVMGSVLLYYRGEPIYQKSFGYADRSEKIPLTKESKFRVGSISKTFTSVLVFKAIEEGRLNLVQSIEGFFPELPNAEKITLSDLLSHRSGIYSFTSSQDYLTWNTVPKSREELYQIILAGKSEFEPGTKANYSNPNYVLLTWILEDTYQESYPYLLQKYVLGPLDLNNTYIGEEFSPDQGEVLSYRFLGEWQQESITDMSIPLGAGALVSTPGDLTVFIRALFEGKLISEASLSQMTELRDNYGRGIFKFPFYDYFAYGHDGGIDGFMASLSYFPEKDLAYSLTLNGANMDPNQISIAVLSAFFGKDFDIPQFSDDSFTEEELDAFVGVYGAPGFPLDITIRRQKLALIAQATGQPEFLLEHEQGTTFVFRLANLSIEFQPENDQLTLSQSGMKFVLKKK